MPNVPHASIGADESNAGSLHRVLGFWALVAFGVGDILGAGIYALVGEIAGIAGEDSWKAFGVALLVAGMTALSYAELGSRFPSSGGEASFCEKGFGSPTAALFVGWLVLCSGIVSMATVARAFGGYLLEFFGAGSAFALPVVAALFLILIAGINLWGIRQTSLLNILLTIIEASGLLIVLIAGLLFLTGSGASPTPPAESVAAATTAANAIGWTAIFQAGAIAFFAFIGFEDMVNVAEEVKNPKKTLPAAILVAVTVAGMLYMLVIWVATSVVPPAELAASRAPLLEVVNRTAPGIPPLLFTAIALFAVANTGLLNLVMTSRLLYGMARQGLVPAWFGRLHPKTQTPHRATGVILLVAIALAVSGTLGFLAGTTSILILAVFLTVNASLLAIKTFRRRRVPAHEGFRVPAVIPALAGISCLVLVFFVPVQSLYRALFFFALGALLVGFHVHRRSHSRS